ncbi:MAG: MFS transporter [Candidatus Rokuibacteriota bacterium]
MTGKPRFGVLWLANFVLFLSFYMLTVVTPLYARNVVGVAERTVGTLVGVLSLVSVLMKPYAGWVTDRFGRRPVMMIGAFFFVAGSVSYGWCATALALIAARGLHGIGMGLYPTGNTAMVADVVPAERRGEMMGIMGAGANLAMALAPIVGLTVARQFGFGAAFVMSAGLAGAASLLVWTQVRETLREPSRRPLRLGQTLSRSSLFPSALSGSLLATFGVQLAFTPIYSEAHGLNSGAFFVALGLVIAIARGPGGRLSDRVGRAPVAAAGLFFAASGLVTLVARPDLLGLVTAGMLYGIGFGSASPALLAWSVDGVSQQDRGRAIGTYQMAFDLGFAFGAVLSGFAVEAVGFEGTFLAAAGIALTASALALRRWHRDLVGATQAGTRCFGKAPHAPHFR